MKEARPEVDGQSLAKGLLILYSAEVTALFDALVPLLGRKVKPSDVETVTWTLGLLGRTYSAGQFVKTKQEWELAGRIMGQFHEAYDIYLTPTLAYPPVKIGELALKPIERVLLKVINSLGLGRLLIASGVTDKLAVENLSKTPFTQLANFTGQPAMSVPLHWTPRTTCPAACSLWGAMVTKPPCCGWPRNWRTRSHGLINARRFFA